MSKLVDAWYRGSPWLLLLRPFSLVFERLVAKRRSDYRRGKRPVWDAPVPVIVVGNITVGGVGKTPLVVALVEIARQAGFQPGIVSRGYGGKAPFYPFPVTSASETGQVGDEPLMLARRCACPVVISPKRVLAARYLLEQTPCDLIISDDGLQHYALGRDLEIAVVDGKRGLGNGQLLPAGPLREPPSRLDSVDWVIVNGASEVFDKERVQSMQLQPRQLVNLATGETRPAKALAAEPVHALAGIGNPQRFFDTLQKLGYRLERHAFADHHVFSREDLPADDGKAVIMTEKDAVKCTAIADERYWYLQVEAQLDAQFINVLQRQIKDLSGLKKMSAQ